MDNIHSKALLTLVGSDYVLTEHEQTGAYLYDEIEYTLRPKAHTGSVVVKPACTKEVSAVMAYANQNGIPVVVRGGGTGLVGGAVPVCESIILSMERLNHIVEIDTDNMMAVLEAGVTLANLLEALKGYPGIGFPVHPGDEGAQMGGMAVTNAGGARAVRHGITRGHIKGLEIVLPDGEIMQLGGKLLKDNAGYSLMHLILGSEGTLAVVTKLTLRLYPEDKHSASVIVSFPTVEDASQAVLKLLSSGTPLLAVEYQDKQLNLKTAELLGLQWPLKRGDADLILILSEQEEADLYKHCKTIDAICTQYGALESFIACTRQEQEEVLAVRSGSYEVIKHLIYHSFDMAVPPASMPAFLHALRELAASYDTTTNITAHIADGNVHNDILLVDGEKPAYYREMLDRMYEICFSFGGTITGEHGIGKLRVKDLKLQKSKTEILLMQKIKEAFDPNGILNPGSVLEAREVKP